MLKNIDTKILNLDGTPALNGQKEASMKDLIIDCLMDGSLLDQGASGEDKLKNYLLAVRCKDGGEVDLSIEDLALLKKLVGKKYAPLAVGQFYQFCD